MFFRSIIVAFSMYSKIPMPTIEWNKKNMKYALCYFPFVGIVIGLVTYGIGSIGYYYKWNQLLFSSIMTLIPVVITGGIHIDGFLDTIDALSSHSDYEKRLEILKDPHSGAFSVIGGISYFVLSLGVWSTVSNRALVAICISFVISRTMSAFSIASFPLAKNTGLAATFQGGAHKKTVKISMVIFYVIESIVVILIQPYLGISCIITSLFVFIYHYHICTKYFGGITGDLAGYFLQICEISMISIISIVANILL